MHFYLLQSGIKTTLFFKNSLSVKGSKILSVPQLTKNYNALEHLDFCQVFCTPQTTGSIMKYF